MNILGTIEGFFIIITIDKEREKKKIITFQVLYLTVAIACCRHKGTKD